jgi:hypothetical protein
VVVAGAGVALAASFTHPFTVGADVVTAVPLAVVFVVMLVTIPARRERNESPTRTPTPSSAVRPGADRRWLWWSAPVLAVTGWEFYCYVSLPRVDHPTLSVLIDMLDGSTVGKFVAFVLWLALGWFLVKP